jgi:hypothetical protein
MPIDQKVRIKRTRVISPVSPAATGTISGQVIDTAGRRATTFVIAAGAQTTTNITVTPVIKHGTVTGTLTSVADSLLIGTEAAAALNGTAGANGVSTIGYIGANRYVTCDLIVTAAATGVYSVTVDQGSNLKSPV